MGPAREVARQVLADQSLFDELFDGIAEDNPTIRNRATRVVAEVTEVRPDWLAPYKSDFLNHIMALDHWIVRANVCKILPRFPNLNVTERRRMFRWAESLLPDPSSVVKACALDCLVRLSFAPHMSREFVLAQQHVQRSMIHGDTPALRARARKMDRLLKRRPPNPN